MKMNTHDYTFDERGLAVLMYPLPVLACAALVLPGLKANAFLKFHALQALTLCLMLALVNLIVGLTMYGLGCMCTAPLWIAVPLWPAYLVYRQGTYDMPLVASFARRRGWVTTGSQAGGYDGGR
jgi:uncharacterized membrane protein